MWGRERWTIPLIRDEAMRKGIVPTIGNEPVVCFDEKPTQLHDEKYTGRRINTKGKPRTIDYEYIRKSTANIFVAVEPKAGKHTTSDIEEKQQRNLLCF